MNGSRNEHTGGQCTDGNSMSTGQKPRNSRYRTKLCRNFPLGTCRFGHNCSYLHISPTAASPAASLVSPIPTAARSFFYPSFSISSVRAPSVSTTSQQKTAPDAPRKDARPVPVAETRPAPLPQPHDGRRHASRRDQPHRRALLPRPCTPADDYSASECPDSQNFIFGRNQDRTGVARWRRRQESAWPEAIQRCAPAVNADMDTDAAVRQFPPAPPATPVSVASPEARWKDLGEAAVGGAGVGERYRWTGNEVLRWANANATGSRGSQSPPPQQHISSTMARNSQAPVLFKHRNQFFKTKPCRFYTEPGGCIKGDRCNFIHEHPGERNGSGLVAPAGAYPESEPEPELSGAESSVPDDMLSPLSPSTAATSEHVLEHAEQKKNYYPVTWRVVGGGVMMSGKREVCEAFMAGQCSEGVDCRYAHPESSEPEYLITYAEPPPLYSPISPMVSSPVYYAYPYMYPTISPPQPFALPAMPGPMPSVAPFPAAAIPQSKIEATQSGHPHMVLPSLMSSPDAQPSGLPYSAYSPHRVVDGSTLVDQTQQSYLYPEGGLYAETLFAARSMVRPVSTPPNGLHGPQVGVAQLFAAEMP